MDVLPTSETSAITGVGAARGASERDHLQEQLDLQASALRAAANGILITDTRGDILWANAAFTKMTGYALDEVLGHNPRLLKSGEQSPEMYAELWATISAGQVWQGQLVNRRRDGSTYVEEMTITPVADASGAVVRFIAVKQDVTARHRAEAKLRQALAELEIQYHAADRARAEARAILDAASEAMVLVSPDGRLHDANQAFCALLGRPVALLVGQDAGALAEDIHRVFADPAALTSLLERAKRSDDGQFSQSVVQMWPATREYEVFSTPVRGPSGQLLGRLYVFNDMTREREMDRMKSEFVALASHELRTPLTSIKGYTDLVLDGDAGQISEEQAGYLGVVRSNTNRLMALVNDLLDISRIEAGRIDLHPSWIAVEQVVESVVQSFQPLAAHKQQRIEASVSAPLPPVWGDTDRTTQVLTNLVSNAHKYTPAGGRITVGAMPSGDFVSISVRDTGIGISAEDGARLFTRFYRIHNEATAEVSGTGLGLSIARSLVEMQGGTITLESVPGKGSTFAFTLPTKQRLG